jgi:hypothetical protein
MRSGFSCILLSIFFLEHILVKHSLNLNPGPRLDVVLTAVGTQGLKMQVTPKSRGIGVGKSQATEWPVKRHDSVCMTGDQRGAQALFITNS